MHALAQEKSRTSRVSPHLSKCQSDRISSLILPASPWPTPCACSLTIWRRASSGTALAQRSSVPASPSRLRIAAATFARKITGADSWVVGYPKCGNTWFGLMLRKALTMAYGLDEAAIPRILSDWRFGRPFARVPAIGVTHHMPLFNVEGYRDMTIDLDMFRGRSIVL